MVTPLHVLILEDTPDDVVLMLHELEQTGFDPAWHCVETEAAYLDHLDQDWEVILADYTLTQFDALRALALLKEREHDVPFIVVTGSISEEAAVECMKRGASDYLLKDRLARLGPAVQHALEEKRIRDEKRQAEEALVQARDEAEEMNRLKDAFLANMSHEIRTPLTAIIGFADLAAAKAAESQRGHIRQIKTSSYRLLNTLNSVLDLSMLEAGTLTLNRDVLDVAAEVQQTVQLLHTLARDKGLDVQVQLPASKVEALLDRACLGRILNNLVGNAIKFTERGEVTVAVHARAEQVEIVVSDTGIGISEAFMPRLFEAFKQESTGLARSHEGTGLGLAITKKLVSLMEGEITVESRKSEGSRFTVAFPRLITQPEASTKTPDDGGLFASGKRLPWPTRVLTVDDNPAMLYLLERFLEEVLEVQEVGAAGDEETALALARLHRYDVVLLDINLGVIRTGVDVLHELRQVPEYATIPAVAVTAYALPGDRERFLEAGFDAYLGKPFTEEELRQVLIEVLLAQDRGRPHQSMESVG